MREFFRGWKRKTGCVMLLIAYGFLGSWIRSLTEVDQIHFVKDSRTLHVVYSCPAGLGWTRIAYPAPHFRLPFNPPWELSVVTFTAKNCNSAYPYNWNDTSWGTGWRRFRTGTCYIESRPGWEEIAVSIVPHWSFVLPLTLLAAWLILSKPTHSKPVTTATTKSTDKPSMGFQAR